MTSTSWFHRDAEPTCFELLQPRRQGISSPWPNSPRRSSARAPAWCPKSRGLLALGCSPVDKSAQPAFTSSKVAFAAKLCARWSRSSTKGSYRCSARKALRIIKAASVGGTCSQIRITLQPSAVSAVLTARSRSTFRLNFADQYSKCALGVSPWSGHRCHQHPSTKTHRRGRAKTRSGRTLIAPASMRRLTRKRKPWRNSSDLRASSGRVSRLLFACIADRTITVVAEGDSIMTRKSPQQ